MKNKTVEVDLGDQVLRFNQEAIEREIEKARKRSVEPGGILHQAAEEHRRKLASLIGLDLSKVQAPPKK